MDKTLRSILWILVALVMLSSFSAGWFFVSKEKLYGDYVNLETLFKTTMERLNREVTTSNRKKIELETKLDAVKKEFAILESRNEDLKSEYKELLKEKGDLDKELVRVKKGKFFVEKRLKEMGSERFVASLLREKVSLEVELKRLMGLLEPKNSEKEKLKVENMDLSVKVSKLEKENFMLEQKIADSSQVAEVLSLDLLKEKSRSEEGMQEFEDVKAENYLLRAKLGEFEEAIGKFDKLLAEKEDQIERLKVAFARHQTQMGVDEVRAETYQAPSEVELPPIFVEGGYPARSTTRANTSPLEKITNLSSRSRGRIITINRDHDFVVIDLGRRDNVDVGTYFDVYKGGLAIGSIEVIQIRDRISACDIKHVKDGYKIEVDDLIAR